LDELAKSKDRLKIGKTMLNLKSQYPDDKILRRLILQEFSDTRLIKYPAEYTNVDNMEETMRKFSKTKGIDNKAFKKHFLTLADIEKPDYTSELMLKTMFKIK